MIPNKFLLVLLPGNLTPLIEWIHTQPDEVESFKIANAS